MDGFTHSVSVVIPAHEYTPELIETLEALVSDGAAEIIVVIDCESFDMERLRQDVSASDVSMDDSVKILRAETNRGPAYYRNVGAAEATSGIVLFLDYDCKATAGLIEGHLRQYSRDEIGAVAGVTELEPPDETLFYTAILASEYTDSYTRPKDVDEVGWTPASNLSVRKEVLEEIQFDDRFPQRGGGEDIDLCWRIRASGYKIGTAPDAVVHHELWESVSGIFRRVYRWGRAETLLIIKHPSRRRRDPWRLLRVLRALVSNQSWQLLWVLVPLRMTYNLGVQLEKVRRGRLDLLNQKITFDE